MQKLRCMGSGHRAAVQALAFSPDGRRALSGGEDHHLKLYDVESGKELRDLFAHQGWVLSVAFCPDGTRALSGSQDKTVKLWDLSEGTDLATWKGHEEAVRRVAVSQDGTRALSGDDGGAIVVWDVAAGRTIRYLVPRPVEELILERRLYRRSGPQPGA